MGLLDYFNITPDKNRDVSLLTPTTTTPNNTPDTTTTNEMLRKGNSSKRKAKTIEKVIHDVEKEKRKRNRKKERCTFSKNSALLIVRALRDEIVYDKRDGFRLIKYKKISIKVPNVFGKRSGTYLYNKYLTNTQNISTKSLVSKSTFYKIRKLLFNPPCTITGRPTQRELNDYQNQLDTTSDIVIYCLCKLCIFYNETYNQLIPEDEDEDDVE